MLQVKGKSDFPAQTNSNAFDPDATVLGPAFYKRYANKNDVGFIMGLDARLIQTGPVSEIRARGRDNPYTFKG
jgi:hypothetical protein